MKFTRSLCQFGCLLLCLNVSLATASKSKHPIPGQIVDTYKIPSEIKSLNGLAWDGSQLWGVDYINNVPDKFSKYLPSMLNDLFFSGENKLEGANAYRFDVPGAADGEVPAITRTLNLGYPKMEGLAHDGKNTLLVGPRIGGTRSGARIVAINDRNKKIHYELADYLWPDGEKHGDYKDPDGIAYGEGLIFWLINAGHSDVPTAAIQVMKISGEVIKRFWLPDKIVNDIAYAHGHIVYKSVDNNLIHLIAVNNVINGVIAEVWKTIPISNGEVTAHWGVTHDSEQYLYVSQDQPGGTIWKIYLPKSMFE